ncbi:Ataxin-10 [Coemansia asiatica]|uniref:Ataxin-10 homolog n=1 Tax=Coemansia asiatica TaxID=1052880 RepID=A0A9W7XRJ6_9FUNG|nr:Ataxin-10 [Coemansia asiatica]
MEPDSVTASQEINDRLFKECAEYRQNSPHPSRPNIPKLIEPSAWLRVHILFQQLILNLEQNNDSIPKMSLNFEALEHLCIFVRNAAAMDKANQVAARKHAVVDDIKETIAAMTTRELVWTEAMKCGTAAAQALSNIVTGNKELQLYLMESELLSCNSSVIDKKKDPEDSVYWHLLSSASGNTRMAGLVLLLNSIKVNSALARLLCSSDNGRLIAQKIGQMFGDDVNDESEAKTILYVLLAQFIENGCLADLLTETPTLDMFGLVEALAVYCNENKDLGVILNDPSVYMLLQSLSGILKSTHRVLGLVWDSKPATVAVADSNSPIDTDYLVSTHRSMAATLSALGLLTTDCSAEAVDQMIQSGIPHRVIELLGLLSTHLPRIESAKDQQDMSRQLLSEDSVTKQLFMFKRDLIRIIGNLAHRHTTAQNLIRDLDGLALVLDHMKIDDNHPFIKEYAIVALKSLLQGNTENQDFIRKMDDRGIAADQDPKLAASMGILPNKP